MPINYKNYPEEWKKISRAVIAKAGDKCELCHRPNHQDKVVLTVHHINFDITDNSKHNLIPLCQRCHLRLDRGHHLRKRKVDKNYWIEKVKQDNLFSEV